MKHDNLIVNEGYPFIIFLLIVTIFVAFLGGNRWLIVLFFC